MSNVNTIVRYLLANGPFDMRHLATIEGVTTEDRRQFCRLVGYSGFDDLTSGFTPELKMGQQCFTLHCCHGVPMHMACKECPEGQRTVNIKKIPSPTANELLIKAEKERSEAAQAFMATSEILTAFLNAFPLCEKPDCKEIAMYGYDSSRAHRCKEHRHATERYRLLRFAKQIEEAQQALGRST